LPAWSPDSSLIAFFSNRTDDNGDIYVMNVDGSTVTRVTTDEEFDGYPEWSPDSSHLIFMSWRDNNQELYSVTLDGEDETNLTNNPTMNEALATIADDGTIAYRANIAAALEFDDANQLLLVYGIATMFISTVLLVGAMLVLVREGRPPFGAMTLLWTVAFALVATQDDGYLMIPLGLATGLIADILLRVLNVRYEVPGRFVLFAFLVPVVYFIIYFVLFRLMVGEIGWTIDVWSGSIFLAGIVASLLAYAMLPGSLQTQPS
jgi:dipeptidyl aminopeptidase/acylaminoacyl peptidase